MLTPNTYYPVYNHANDDENLFRSCENYRHFLRQLMKYIEPVTTSYAYYLVPSHFHFLIRTRSGEDLKKPGLTGFQNLSGLVSKRFCNLFNSYAKASNKQYGRSGSLSMRPFKSKEIATDDYLVAVVNYIHRDPVYHGFCRSVR